ncbi:chloroplastic group IIA intron splicing facilitator CRS1, chloroplastic [Quillaja saponaria]|uniref:Chloroplastic group IIA intron splicing facilitator CRS1, chloroplastic n=1 Tax=Quillaja saponaria TaxID=32244 RepID=A0AAD7PXZ3_QUISA|nr:chloroplastic group IIA intron splicing facilitator CRS1, chloroplastic [Quillaja saponaria]
MHKLLSEKHGHRESVATGTHCKEFQNCQPVSGSLYEREANRLWDQKTSPNAIPSSIFSKKIPLHEGNIDLSQVNSHENIMDKLLSEKHGGGESVATGTQCKEIQNCQPVSGSLYEREADRLLDGLGPRFIDWWMHKPLPVDADLLPEVITGFRPPFRLCPPRARAKMTDNKLTHLRKLAQSLPTHFVLGRNRKLQGLAAAILKLWEKSLIAKIAVKYGIPNTNNEEMANELKWLTGGVLLLRNKYFIILYRGNDFLPNWVANLIKEREMELKSFQLEEEGARIGAVEAFPAVDESLKDSTTSGTLSEFQNIQKEFGYVKNTSVEVEVRLEAEKETLERELRKQEHKAFILKKKIEKSARELSKLSTSWMPADQDGDLEILTKEERECFRKIGLKMDCCLVLGRRGVFDGVMEGLFQHWKHREVLKVITMQRVFRQVIYTAKLLEAESGGILVSVDKIKEGHAIIIFRGKNYRRSSKPIAKSLLNKKEALQRSLEMQRIGSLKFFAYQRQQMISGLKLKLTNLKREIDHIEIEKQ